jgi:hypothetical protein
MPLGCVWHSLSRSVTAKSILIASSVGRAYTN